MKYLALVTFALLTACVDPREQMNSELAAHLEAERDFHADQQYREDIYNHRAFRPEVYAEPEFEADCDYYQMEECYE